MTSQDEAPTGRDESVLALLAGTWGADAVTVRLPGAADLEPAAAAAPPGPGASRFVERGLVGRGGLGEVVEAFDRDLRRRVALKRVRPDRPCSGQAVARLVEEAQLTAQLEHPNVPAVHALGADGQGRPFFAMAYIEGMTLAELIEARGRDPEVARAFGLGRLLRIFLQVGYAVAFAHDRGVLHRDLKPANVLLGRFGEVRVMDWGLARLVERPGPGHPEAAPPLETTSGRPPSLEGAVVGTPGYMSPEQADGRLDLDPRSDVYALGALLFALLAGTPPVRGEGTPAVLRRTLEGRLEPLPRAVPPALADVVRRALAREPEARYPDVLALLRDIEAVLEDRLTSLQQARSAWSRIGWFYVARHPRFARLRTLDLETGAFAWFLFGAALGVGLAGWLSGWWWALLLAGVAFHLPLVHTLLRRARPDDPGGLQAALEGVTGDSGVSTARAGSSAGATTQLATRVESSSADPALAPTVDPVAAPTLPEPPP